MRAVPKVNVWPDRQTDTHTQDNYCNPHCTCVPKVNVWPDRQTDRHTHKTTTVTLTAHARLRLMSGRTDRQTHTQDNYCNPHCTCTPKVNVWPDRQTDRHTHKTTTATLTAHARLRLMSGRTDRQTHTHKTTTVTLTAHDYCNPHCT